MNTTLKRIVAKNLGLPDEQVTMDGPDTDTTPDSGPTAASRTIIINGFLFFSFIKFFTLKKEM